MSGKTYEIIIQPYSTGRLVGAGLSWKASVWRVEDNQLIEKAFITHWGAKRWCRKANLDRQFRKFVDGGQWAV